MNHLVGSTALALALVAMIAAAPASAEPFGVDPSAGDSSMQAVFDAPLGERITAVSSAVECTLDIRPDGTAKGRCSIPLTSIVVDNNDTKTDHFRQWATNKKSEPAECNFALAFENAKVTGEIKPETPLPFEAEGTFTICGKKNAKDKKEKITGTAVLFPPDTYYSKKTIRIRARIEGFNRDDYQVGPEWTAGFLARVQRLANVVAKEGAIEVTLFAKTSVPD